MRSELFFLETFISGSVMTVTNREECDSILLGGIVRKPDELADVTVVSSVQSGPSPAVVLDVHWSFTSQSLCSRSCNNSSYHMEGL